MKKSNITGLCLILSIISIFCITGIAFGDDSSSVSSSSQSSGAAIAKSVVATDADNAAAEDDKKKQKGLDEGFQEVDPNGAFQYQYPIDLPPGTHDLAPTLKLFYNSNCSNGMLGMGWSLAGISKIERDFTYAVNYDSTDHFIYNGDRLVYGSDGYYHPAKESYERIEFKNQNSSSSYWVITQKDGTKMYYGYQATEHTASTDGRIAGIGASGSDTAIVWLLSKVMDVLGNYYVIEYTIDGTTGAYYPVRITYTKNENNAINKYRTVEFSYETRTDHCAMYNPTYADMQKRLKWITVKIGGNLLRKYRLDYEYGASTAISRLTTIQEYGSDGNTPPVPWVDGSYITNGKTLPVSKFGWGDKSAGSSFAYNGDWTSTTTSNVSVVGIGDVDGDGKADLILQYDLEGSRRWQARLATGSSFTYNGDWTSTTTSNVSVVGIGDVNGDGKADMILQYDLDGSRRWQARVSQATPDLIVEIVLNNGEQLISYSFPSQISGAVNLSSSSYPNIANTSPSPLVTQITYDDGLSHPMTYTYSYYNGMIHTGTPSERCNLGFAWIEKTDSNSATSIRTYYHQDGLDLRLMEDKIEITSGTSRTMYIGKQYKYYKKQIVDNSSNSGLPSSDFIYPSDEYTYNYNGDSSGTPMTYHIKYGYDAYGNLIQKIDYGDTTVATDDIEYDATYGYDSDTNISLVTAEQLTGILLSGKTGLFGETDYVYDANYLLAKRVLKNSDQDISNSYSYDNYGNVTAITDGNNNTTTIKYDSNY
jgi:hypothetical protein